MKIWFAMALLVSASAQAQSIFAKWPPPPIINADRIAAEFAKKHPECVSGNRPDWCDVPIRYLDRLTLAQQPPEFRQLEICQDYRDDVRAGVVIESQTINAACGVHTDAASAKP